MSDHSKESNPDYRQDPPVPAAPGDTECLVSWRQPDGTVVSTGPIPKDRAERLADAYRRLSPGQQYWVGPLPPELQAAREGRVRRRRFSGTGGSGH